MARHCGEDLCFEQDAVIIYKKKIIIKKIKKKLAKLEAWKGDLGNRERPGGLKTRKGGPGKNKRHKKKHTPGGLKTRKGDPGKS